MNTTSRRRLGERGAITVEIAILTPVLLAILAFVVAAGRVGKAHTTVDTVAQATARAASLARTSTSAQADARDVAGQMMTQQGLDCASQSVDVDTSGFATRLGQPATITATVSCTVPLSDLALPGLPGSRTITATATSPLDAYRERR